MITKLIRLALQWSPIIIERIKASLRPLTVGEALEVQQARARCALAEAMDADDGDEVAAVFKRGERLVLVPTYRNDGDDG